MVPRPDHDTVLLITHPGGGRTFDYGDYWDRRDLIYTGRGLRGDQRMEGANRDVAENRRRLLLFESAGAEQLAFLGGVECADHWESIAPDRDGADRRIYRFRLRGTSGRQIRRSRSANRGGGGRTTRQRDASSFTPRPFDPNRKGRRRRPSAPGDPERRRVLAEQADQAHQRTLRDFGLWLSGNGWVDLEEIDGATDLIALRRTGRRTRRALFEIKSITPTSERARVRSGLAQLLEYRFFLGEPDDALCLVSSRPINDGRLRLLDSLGIAHAYVEKGQVHVSGTQASRRLFGRLAS